MLRLLSVVFSVLVLFVTVTQFGFQDFFTTFAGGVARGSAEAVGGPPAGDAQGSQNLSRSRSAVSAGVTETIDASVCGILGSLRGADDGSDIVFEEPTDRAATSDGILVLPRLLVCSAALAVLLTVDGMALVAAVGLADVGGFDNAFGTGGAGGTRGVAGVTDSAGLGNAGGTTELGFT